MKHIVIITLLFLVLAGCAGTGGGKNAQETPLPGGTDSIGTHTQRTDTASSYYTGDGGSGLRLAVLEPLGFGLSASEQWVTSLVQGSITADFNRFTAMTVIDRQNLETVLAEQNQSMSGNYSDDDYIRIGHLINARLVLTGSIRRTASTYMLELAVTDVESGERKASYPPTPVTLAGLENLSAVKEATASVLEQLGVRLTVRGLEELKTPLELPQVEAQTALARGISANQQGSIVEAMNYFYEAASWDSGLVEATQRLERLSTQIESGNLGENIRNEIQLRNAWRKLLEDAIAFYDERPIVNLVYHVTPRQGAINFNRNTVELIHDFWIEPNSGANVVYKIVKALAETKKAAEWGLVELANELLTGGIGYYTLQAQAELFDNNGVYLDKAEKSVYVGWYGRTGSGQNDVVRFADFTGAQSITLIPSWCVGAFSFTVNADKAGDGLEIQFPTVGKLYGSSSRRIRKNAADTIRIIPTDKTFTQYFSNRRDFRVIGERVYYYFR